MTGRATTPAALRELMATRVVCSTFAKLSDLEVVDLLAQTALDLVVVDLEHSQLDEGQARRLVRHAAALGLPSVVRVPAVDAGQINRLLEAGAVGVQLSSVEDPAQVGALVEATRFAPHGRRSVSVGQPAAGYGARGVADYVASTDGHPLLVAQVETALDGGVGDLHEALGDVDVVFIGTTDLSVAVGHPGDTAHPDVTRAIDAIATAVGATSAALGGWAASADEAAELERLGARYITIASDLAALGAAFGSRFGTAGGGDDRPLASGLRSDRARRSAGEPPP